LSFFFLQLQYFLYITYEKQKINKKSASRIEFFATRNLPVPSVHYGAQKTA